MKVCHIILEQRTISRKQVQPGCKDQPLCWCISRSKPKQQHFRKNSIYHFKLHILAQCIFMIWSYFQRPDNLYNQLLQKSLFKMLICEGKKNKKNIYIYLYNLFSSQTLTQKRILREVLEKVSPFNCQYSESDLKLFYLFTCQKQYGWDYLRSKIPHSARISEYCPLKKQPCV